MQELISELMTLSPEDLSRFASYIAALESRGTPVLPSVRPAEGA